MTNNEAVSRIKFLLDVGGSDGFTSSDKEALNTAINALSECKKPKTNGDKIRAMSDEELAKLFDKAFMSNDSACNYCGNNHPDSFLCEEISCEEGFLKWLKQEAKEDGQCENPATV